MTPCALGLSTLLAAALASPATWAAGAAGAAHQHGLASLELVAEGATLTLRLDSPLDNLLGFERGPRTEAERKAVQAMAQRFHAGAALVVPTPAAGCTLQGVSLASAVIAPALLAAPGAAAPAATPPKPAADAHADLEAELRFQCSQPAALKGVGLGGLFKAFPRLHQLDTAVVAPGVQRGLKLGPKKPDLAW